MMHFICCNIFMMFSLTFFARNMTRSFLIKKRRRKFPFINSRAVDYNYYFAIAMGVRVRELKKR